MGIRAVAVFVSVMASLAMGQTSEPASRPASMMGVREALRAAVSSAERAGRREFRKDLSTAKLDEMRQERERDVDAVFGRLVGTTVRLNVEVDDVVAWGPEGATSRYAMIARQRSHSPRVLNAEDRREIDVLNGVKAGKDKFDVVYHRAEGRIPTHTILFVTTEAGAADVRKGRTINRAGVIRQVVYRETDLAGTGEHAMNIRADTPDELKVASGEPGRFIDRSAGRAGITYSVLLVIEPAPTTTPAANAD